MTSPQDTTQLLLDLRHGDRTVREELLKIVYDELRDLASRHMQRERANHTLQPTALAHELYIRLIEESEVDWQGHAHFLAVASSVIRRILIDHARQHRAAKRGGALQRVPIPTEIAQGDGPDIDLLALDEALRELETLHERHHRIVELRFFGGLTNREIAEVLGVSTTTVNTDWQAAKAWLRRRLGESGDS